jgi:hypothetical protein
MMTYPQLLTAILTHAPAFLLAGMILLAATLILANEWRVQK